MPSKIKNLNLDKTKESLDRILSQAKESVKVLEMLQKEGLERAKTWMQLPTKDETMNMANKKLVMGLKKLGLATRSEVDYLEKKVEDLASELRSQISKLNKKTATNKKDSASDSAN